MKWVGPFTVEDLLQQCIEASFLKPPESGSAYVVSVNSWKGSPDASSKVLYVGGNTGKSNRFRTRVGDLLADMCGFFGDETGHHSGGQSLHHYCREQQIVPLQLHIGWLETCDCHRCAEIQLYRDLNPLLNKNRPSRCSIHDDR